MEYVAIVILIILLVIFVESFIECILSAKRYQKSAERLINAYKECIDNWNKDNEIITENDKEKENDTNS